jgi:hypothetical protein
MYVQTNLVILVILMLFHAGELPAAAAPPKNAEPGGITGRVTDTPALAQDKSPPLTSAAVEQTAQGTKAPPLLVESFDGLGDGFKGPQGTATFRNPSDNSLAVGSDHIVQLVNTKMAVFTKKGARFDTTGKVLYGPVNTGNVFKDFADFGELNSGDAVVRYDQLADRWLIVMPMFRRLPFKKNQPAGQSGGPVQLSLPGVEDQPGAPKPLYQPAPGEKAAGAREGKGQKEGSYAICYAVSTGPDPVGSYYRYMFARPLFLDYPRPARLARRLLRDDQHQR